MPIIDAEIVSIKFSPDGEYLALFRKKRNILQIYTVEGDLHKLMEKIENDGYIS